MSALFPHTVTFWHKDLTPSRCASYSRRVLTSARWEEAAGENSALPGNTSANEVTVLIDGSMGEILVTPGDKLAFGEITDAGPIKNSVTVVSVEAIRLRNKVHHWVVTCQ